eukprot:c24648_g1_i2 orf=1-351(-)
MWSLTGYGVSPCSLSKRGLATTSTGVFFRNVNPRSSVMSKSSGLCPDGRLKLKLRTRFAAASCIINIARDNPGQIRLPVPKGINSGCRPLISVSRPMNLSGRNSSGLSHVEGHRPMA